MTLGPTGGHIYRTFIIPQNCEQFPKEYLFKTSTYIYIHIELISSKHQHIFIHIELSPHVATARFVNNLSDIHRNDPFGHVRAAPSSF